MEERPRLAPAAFDRSRGTAENVGRVFNRQAAEKPQLDDPSQLFVELRQPFERCIERDDLGRAFGGSHVDIFHGNERNAAAAFVRQPLSRMVHGELPHRFRGYGEEMTAIVSDQVRLLGQLQIRLVNQRRGLQRVVATAVKPPARDRAQLAIHQRHQAIDGFSIASTPGGEQLRDRRDFGCHERSSRRILSPYGEPHTR